MKKMGIVDSKNRNLVLILCSLLMAVMSLIFAGCQATPVPTNTSMNVIDAAVPSMPAILREGDLIQVTFATSTNLNTTQRIQPDGQISLQFVNNVSAAGKTPLELAKALETAYQPHLRGVEPITVTVISNTAAVYVTGAVLRPGRIPLDRPFTVLDAIMEAGGVDNTRAKLSSVTVLRIENGQRISRRLNLKKALEGKDPSLFYLKAYDIIYVPDKPINF